MPPETPPDSANDGVVSLVVPPWLGVTVGSAVGADVPIVHVCVAAGPWLPAASTSATRKVCAPSASDGSDRGLVQAAYVLPSRLQTYVSPPTAPAKEKEAVVWLVFALGPLTIVGVVVGAVVSTVQVVDVAGPVLPAPSITRTQKVWVPSPRTGSVIGEVQATHAPASVRHW